MAEPDENANFESPTGGQANSMGVLVQTLVALFEALLGPSPCEWLTIEPNLDSEKFDLIWKATDGMHAVQVKHSINGFSRASVDRLTKQMYAQRFAVAVDGRCECKLVLVGHAAKTLSRVRRMNGVVVVIHPLNQALFLEIAAFRLGKFLEKEKLQPGGVKILEDLAAMLALRLLEASSRGQMVKRSLVVEMLQSWIFAIPDSAAATRIFRIAGLDRLPRTVRLFFGRDEDMRKLDDAWNSRETRVLSFVALGGAGKTTLVKKWLERLGEKVDYDVYIYSFYNQSAPQGRSSKEGQMSAHHFLREALRHFGDKNADDEGSLENKGERLAALLQAQRTLLFLDGLETLQNKVGEHVGALIDQGIHRLLVSLAKNNPGLCIITSRLPICDLDGYPYPSVRQEALGKLSRHAGSELLRTLGVNGDTSDIEQVVDEYDGHALALTLLGEYLAKYHQGDTSQRSRIPPLAHELEEGGKARRVMESYEKILRGRPSLALLYILGLFDRPASEEAINAVINPTSIRQHNSERFLLDGMRALNSNSTAGLHNDSARSGGKTLARITRSQQWKIKLRIGLTNALRRTASFLAIRKITAPLSRLTQLELEQAIYELRDLRLIDQPGSSGPGTIDCHPFVRTHFGEAMRGKNRFAWREAHSRLFEHYRSIAPDLPDTITAMEPLYAAVAHGCQAKRYLEAGLGVYLPRMLRGGVYSVNTLGLLTRDLAVLTYFFDVQWTQPARGLIKQEKATILYWSGTLLATLSHYKKGVQALVEAKRINVQLKSWKGASASARYISELRAGFGDLNWSLEEARDSVKFAELIKSDYELVGSRATLGHCLHQLGRWNDARAEFRAAEEALHKADPETEFLHSLWGYWYCDLLLDSGNFQEAEKRATKALGMAADQRMFAMGKLLDAAVAELTLARTLMLTERSSGSNEFPRTDEHLGKAADGIQRVGHQWLIPQSLLSRAEFHRLTGNLEKTAQILDTTKERIGRSEIPLKLYQVDCCLVSVELSLGQRNFDQTHVDLALADAAVLETGYHRRDVVLHIQHARLCQLEGANDAAHGHLDKAKEIIAAQDCHRWDSDIGEIEVLLR